jgi:hypothetical protein
LAGQLKAARQGNTGAAKAKPKKKAPTNKKYQDAEDSTDSESEVNAPKGYDSDGSDHDGDFIE